MSKDVINCAVVGYGPSFNMGKFHADMISKTSGLKLVAVADVDESRLEAAKKDFPGIATYKNVDDLLENKDVDLVTIVTPHNTHAPLALKALNSKKHVIVEKPMCITTKEADEMIKAAKENNVMLTVFHNRRLDGDFLTLKEIIESGIIGEVFHIEVFLGGYAHPGHWWRSDKKISGGAMYDWGAHVVDWVLNLVKDEVLDVSGYFYKLVWNDVTNEDHTEALIRFKNGVIANVQISNIAIVQKPRWRILGTKGGILDIGGGNFKLYVNFQNRNFETLVGSKKTDYSLFYTNISEHLREGKELIVKPEEARKVIAVIEAAEKSSKVKSPVALP